MESHNMLQFTMKSANHLPHESEQGLLQSENYIVPYIHQHMLPGNGMSIEEAGLLAASRLEWMLTQARQEMGTTFTRHDFQLLADCFQGDIFHPDQFNSLASLLCDEYGLDVDQLEDGPIAALAVKLAALTPLERVALADALEQAWYRQNPRLGYFEVLAELGFCPSESQAH